MKVIFLREVLEWIGQGQIVVIHIDGNPHVVAATTGIHSVDEICQTVYRRTNTFYCEVYKMQGLSAVKEGIEIWCRNR